MPPRHGRTIPTEEGRKLRSAQICTHALCPCSSSNLLTWIGYHPSHRPRILAPGTGRGRRSRDPVESVHMAPSLPSIGRLESHLSPVPAGGQTLPPGHHRHTRRRSRGARSLLDPPAAHPRQGAGRGPGGRAGGAVTCCSPVDSAVPPSGSGPARPGAPCSSWSARIGRPWWSGCGASSSKNRARSRSSSTGGEANGGSRRWLTGRSGAAANGGGARPGRPESARWRLTANRCLNWITLLPLVRKETIE